MKKFISGIIVGALLFTGASAFADSVSLIGQKVQGLFAIEKGGVKLADAIIINGTAYAPVRVVAEATGADLTVEGKRIIMGEVTLSAPEVIISEAKPDTGLTALQTQRETIARDIDTHEKQIKGYNENILPTYKSLAEELAHSGSLGESSANNYAEFKKQVETWERELITLRSQLVEIDAKIAALGE